MSDGEFLEQARAFHGGCDDELRAALEVIDKRAEAK